MQTLMCLLALLVDRLRHSCSDMMKTYRGAQQWTTP